MAAHFFYYAGWTDKLSYAVPGRQARERDRTAADVEATYIGDR